MKKKKRTKLKCIAKRKKTPEKVTYCMIPTTGHNGKGKTRETIKRSLAARSWNEEMNRLFWVMQILCMIL